MTGEKAGKILLTAILVSLLLVTNVYGAHRDKPYRTQYSATFDGLIAWSSFGLLASDEPTRKSGANLPLLQIYDMQGNAVAAAHWDGSEPKLSKDGNEWTITLTSQKDTGKLSYELKSYWSSEMKLARGRAGITVTALGDVSEAAKYRYALRFAGSGAWISKDGKSAVLATPSRSQEKVYEHAVLIADDSSCAFRSGQIEKYDINKKVEKLYYTEAMSYPTKTGDLAKAKLIGLYITVVNSWSHEPVMDFAAAMSSGVKEPDVRIFGVVDKQTASPGECLEYTYYLMNAGMGDAIELDVTIPVSEDVTLITGSLIGSPGTAMLMPSGEEVKVTELRSDSQAADKNIKSFRWKPKEGLKPGETIQISFSVII